MSSRFDPYREWLGIEQEPGGGAIDHYRLLGLARFESDTGRISAAADERMALVRTFQVGPRAAHSQRLLNELSAARLCLLSPARKAEYDARLRGTGFQPALALPPVVAPPIEPPEAPAPRVAIATANDEPLEIVELAPPVPWWRPIVAMLSAALAVLASVAAWGIVQSQWPEPPPVVIAPPPPEPEPDPEPPPPEPVVQFQEASGEVNLAPATADLRGGAALRSAGLSELLAGFGSPDAAAAWHFRLVEPGFFRLELTYATAADVADGQLEAALGGETKACDLRSTGGLDQFLTDSYTLAIPKSGQHTLVLRPLRPASGDWLLLKSVRLVPVGAGERRASAH